MNFSILFNMQQELDSKIEAQHQLQSENLIERKVLALLVEVGELANETRCFKFWSLKPPASTSVILEEYVDGIHFILSLGLEIKANTLMDLKEVQADSTTITEQFLKVYETIQDFKKDQSPSTYKDMFEEYLLLGKLLGFSSKQVEEAYISKNEVNHQRQEQGY
ncbi:dUTP diphosphatase [Metabacillus litoralis]|uniref:dUTP diphosphatase n=1 Tax=Bacillaceae TaxID=186817 RepID=UPI000BFD6558|nr:MULTISPECIES: dUTP diphosphatase [Bacillaceae]MCM3411050.1 dUTP diphosphatase [Metabacillus litoralis]PGT91263.1 dUTPase [Bacillus sp. AFS040349]UHA62268.1 dUTP diphosphatase [Metabacillus litoralis]